jgi:hypothetical protein
MLFVAKRSKHDMGRGGEVCRLVTHCHPMLTDAAAETAHRLQSTGFMEAEFQSKTGSSYSTVKPGQQRPNALGLFDPPEYMQFGLAARGMIHMHTV